MIAKKRGRPANTSGKRKQQQMPIPDYIKARITARGFRPPKHLLDVLENMEEFQKLITSYRRKFRIKECDALTLISSFNENVDQSSLDEALSKVKCWNKFSHAGLRARGYEIPKWHVTVHDLIAKKYANCSARRLAQMVQEHEKRENRAVPHERSVRRFVQNLIKSGAYLQSKNTN